MRKDVKSDRMNDIAYLAKCIKTAPITEYKYHFSCLVKIVRYWRKAISQTAMVCNFIYCSLSRLLPTWSIGLRWIHGCQ